MVDEDDVDKTHRRLLAEARATRDLDYVDPHYIPAAEIPEGMQYEWKLHSLYGDSDNTWVKKHRDLIDRRGWKPVPHIRHPTIKSTELHKIVVDGMILCERSLELDSRALEAKRAQGLLDAKLSQLRGSFLYAKIGRAPDDKREPKQYQYNPDEVLREYAALSEDELKMASACNLTPEQYAIAKLELRSVGELPNRSDKS